MNASFCLRQMYESAVVDVVIPHYAIPKKWGAKAALLPLGLLKRFIVASYFLTAGTERPI